LDIQLKLVTFEGALALYWRETYLHRTYRQGLFEIQGMRASPLCEGAGGVTSIPETTY
jgi:hypothetical protein